MAPMRVRRAIGNPFNGLKRACVSRFLQSLGDPGRKLRSAVADYFADGGILVTDFVFAEDDFVIGAERGFFLCRAVDLHAVGALAVNNLPAALGGGADDNVSAENAGIVEHDCARFRAPNRNGTVAE